MHFLTQSAFSFLSTLPNHLNLFHFRTLPSASMPILYLNCPLVLFSLKEVPHIHLTIGISVLSSLESLDSCSFIGHVLHPYIVQLQTQLPWTLPFSLSDAHLRVKIGDNSLNFFHARLTLVTTTDSVPPSAIHNIAQVTNLSHIFQNITIPYIETICLHCSILLVWRALCASPTDKRCSRLHFTPLHRLCTHLLQLVHLIELFLKASRTKCLGSESIPAVVK